MEISVVIPTHHRSDRLPALLKSLTEQDYDLTRVEVVVVSNLPDSGLASALCVFGARWPGKFHFRIVGEVGVNRARNLGLETSSGEVILLLDDDCTLPGPSYFQQLRRVHCQYPEAIAVGGAYLTYPKTSRVSGLYNEICNRWLTFELGNVRPARSLLGGCVSYKAQMLRAQEFKFDEAIIYGGSETELHERMISSRQILLFDPGLSVVHDGRISFSGLIRKAFLQGLTKGRKFPKARHGFAAHRRLTPSAASYAYTRAFKLGDVWGRFSPDLDIPIIFVYVALLLDLIALPYRVGADLVRSLYWTGYRVVTALRGSVQRFLVSSYWNARGTAIHIYWWLYGKLSSLKGRSKRGAIWLYWRSYGLQQRLRGWVKATAVNSYWRIRGGSIHLYWRTYEKVQRFKGMVRSLPGLARRFWGGVQRLRTDSYWYLRGRCVNLYWRCYALVGRANGKVRGWYWAIHGMYWRVRGRMQRQWVHWYWTLYPLASHIKRHWRRPLTLLNVRMPLTYPQLETSEAPWWVVRIDENEARPFSSEQVAQWKKLGISGVEIRARKATADPRCEEWRRELSAAGIARHFMVPALTECSLVDAKPGDRNFVVVQASQINRWCDELIEWLGCLRGSYHVQIRLDEDTLRRPTQRFFSNLRKVAPDVELALVLPSERERSRAERFDLFRRLHRFSRQTEDFNLHWRPYYRFSTAHHFTIVGRMDTPEFADASDPSVSVIIPHHRDFDNLLLAIRNLSLQSLGHRQFEVIIVDNAPPEFLLREEQRQELMRASAGLRLCFLSMESANAEVFLAGHARNEGLLHARGKLIQFLDSDIMLPREYLATLIPQMEVSDVFMAKRFMLKENFDADQDVESAPADCFYSEDEYWEGFKAARQWTDLPDYWKYTCAYGFAAKREALLQAGPFDPLFTNYGFEDVDLSFRLFKLGKRFAFAPMWVYHLYPRRDLHNYHFNMEKRLRSLERSAMTLFRVRPEKGTFGLCQGYFAPRLTERFKFF